METKSLSWAIKKTAIGYIFIYINIKIATVDILPNWAGYIMIITALPILAQKVNSAKLLKPLGIILCIGAVINWGLDIIAYPISVHIISVLIGIIGIYFHFQLITNIAEITVDEARKKRLIILRSLTVILDTIIIFISLIFSTIYGEIYMYITFVIAIVKLAACFWITGEFFGLSKELTKEDELK